MILVESGGKIAYPGRFGASLRQLPRALSSPGFSNKIAGFPAFQENAMVVIRLARSGAKKRPFFNMVVADSRNRRDGRFIERIGYYNPVAAANEQGLVINVERLSYWQQNGAQLSPTAARLVKQAAATKAA
jgi:small subunit ribosomal protein S16